jgi:predicted nucleotidyltransferase
LPRSSDAAPPALSANPAHAAAATAAAEFFADAPVVDAVLLVGSWARGRALDSSDLDLAILVRPETTPSERHALVAAWEQSAARAAVAKLLTPIVQYDDVDLTLIDGELAPRPRGWTSGPDDFELRIGNYVAYSVALFERGDRYGALRDRWLPFYDDALRAKRLDSVRTYCLNNLDHIPRSLGRGDRFHAFNRLYHAFQEFMQAAFISRRIYPIAYDKWVADQLEELLGRPDLARAAAEIVGVAELDAVTIGSNAERLRGLFEDCVE